MKSHEMSQTMPPQEGDLTISEVTILDELRAKAEKIDATATSFLREAHEAKDDPVKVGHRLTLRCNGSKVAEIQMKESVRNFEQSIRDSSQLEFARARNIHEGISALENGTAPNAQFIDLLNEMCEQAAKQVENLYLENMDLEKDRIKDDPAKKRLIKSRERLQAIQGLLHRMNSFHG